MYFLYPKLRTRKAKVMDEDSCLGGRVRPEGQSLKRSTSNNKQKDSSKCQYDYIGCDFQGNNFEVSLHMDIAIEKHLELACTSLHELRNDYIARENNVLAENEAKIAFLQEHMSKQSATIKDACEVNADLKVQAKHMETRLAREIQRNVELRDDVTALKMAVGSREDRQEVSRAANYTGSLLWKVTQVAKLYESAQSKGQISVYGPVFYTAQFGYKLQAQLFPNGVGSNTGKYASIFFHVLPGEYDGILSWPFTHKISFGLLEQNSKSNKNISFSLLPSEDENQFERPTGSASEGKGFNKFFPVELYEKGNYVLNDTMYIKIKISNNK